MEQIVFVHDLFLNLTMMIGVGRPLKVSESDLSEMMFLEIERQ
jgi:hypothetical protein